MLELISGKSLCLKTGSDYIQEAFITNTSAEVTPVIELGGNTLGDGVPGPVTRTYP